MKNASLCHRASMDRAALSPLLRSFERHLRAENRSEHTIASYVDSHCQAEAFLAGLGRTLVDARREDLEAFLGELLQRRAPETVATRYRRLRVLYRWLEEEDEITANPMAKMKPPIIPEQPVPVVPEDGLRRLLATCAGKRFEDRVVALVCGEVAEHKVDIFLFSLCKRLPGLDNCGAACHPSPLPAGGKPLTSGSPGSARQ
jgi:hypothetical protein